MSRVLDLKKTILGLNRDGTARIVPWESGPPPRVDGYTIGAPVMTRNAPHGGELHPDADEVLFLVSGKVDVILEEDGGENVFTVSAGEAIVVPRGVWHRVVLREPSQLLHITPGPNADWRPLP